MADKTLKEALVVIEEIPLTEAECRSFRYVRWADLVGIPIFIAWYWLLSSLLAQDVVVNEPALPMVLLVGQAVLAFIGFVTFFYHTQGWPSKAEDDIYHAMKYIGRWLMLTRHCMILQAVHLSLSFYGAATNNSYVLRLTYGATYWVGALGWFVTIQFFTLVFNNKDFVAKCKEMSTKRGLCGLVDFRGFNAWLHVPALPLAVCDVVFAKRHVLLLGDATSFTTTGLMMLFYCIFYIAFVWCNYFATGFFPYAVLRELKSVTSWIIFVVVQTILLLIFVLCSVGLSYIPQPWFQSV